LKAVTYAFPPGYRENAEEEEDKIKEQKLICKDPLKFWIIQFFSVSLGDYGVVRVGWGNASWFQEEINFKEKG
jgi:hypothetical protein